MRRILATAFLLVLGACSSSKTFMSEAECQTAEWRAIGYEDGAQGLGPTVFGKRRKACAEHGVTAKFEAYLSGHEEGQAYFCRPENGYRIGSKGYRYNGICPPHLEGPFMDAYTDGFGLYERRIARDNSARELAQSKARIRQIEHLVVQKSGAMFSPLMLPTERVSLAVEIKQLAEEKANLEDAIPRLEQDYADADREYQDYRASIADRYRG